MSHTRNYTYNHINQLVQYSDPNDTVNYIYYPNGLREEKYSANYDSYNYEGLYVIYYYDKDGRIISEGKDAVCWELTTAVNIWGLNGLVKRTTYETTEIDYLSSATEYPITNYRGDILSNFENYINYYDAYGNERRETVSDNPFGYCGEYTDEESGLIYLRGRYYDPTVGRFISEDPIKDGGNWYAYCAGNPIRYIDPTGYITKEEQEMYENGEMSPMAYSYLMNLTYHWYLADTQESRDYYHQLAVEFRNTGYTTTNGALPYIEEGIEYMPSKPTGIPSKEEHYFRNKLNLQFTWTEMQVLQERLPENLKWDDSVPADLHQNTATEDAPNIKYVSACGHFEIVYNANHKVLNEYNAPSDMGTYNYSNPNDKTNHYLQDVYPYRAFGWFGWGYGNVEK